MCFFFFLILTSLITHIRKKGPNYSSKIFIRLSFQSKYITFDINLFITNETFRCHLRRLNCSFTQINMRFLPEETTPCFNQVKISSICFIVLTRYIHVFIVNIFLVSRFVISYSKYLFIIQHFDIFICYRTIYGIRSITETPTPLFLSP